MPSPTAIKCLVVATATANASIDTMCFDIATAMRRLGIGVRIMLHGETPQGGELLSLLLGELDSYPGPSFVMDTNGKLSVTAGERSFFDVYDIPKFSFITDNPVHQLAHIDSAPDNWLCGLVSTEYMEHLDLFGLSSRPAVLFPHGGPPPLASVLTSAERDIDVLFAGNIKAVEPFEEWLRITFPASPRIERALLAAKDDLASPGAHPFTVTVEALRDGGIDVTRDILAEAYVPLDRYLINRERGRVLGAIRRHTVTVIGDVDGGVIPNDSPHRILGAKTFSEVLHAMSLAKVTLNVVPTFRSGGHERIFYGLSAGSMVLTDRNEFLAPDIKAESGIRFLPDDLADLDDVLSQWTGDSATLDALRPAALQHYSARHSWDQRIKPVLDKLNLEYFA